MLGWLTHLVGVRAQRRPARAVRVVRGRYDAATTTDDNRRHWAAADGLSAAAANSPAVRRTLRNRARYEVANNSYAKGIVLTLAKVGDPETRLSETTRNREFRDRLSSKSVAP